ncbi:MAG: ankyrin repeat domain-containing protein [Candidatus Eremiobacteraeota bacterium]|nr:ankyrin repeat domain-containing protein [Candidatus Eremiobacteraeota bacterium]
MVRWLEKSLWGVGRLREAVEQGRAPEALRLLRSGVPVRDTWGSLFHAVEQGDLELCHCLLNNGADPDALDGQGNLPLHHAIRNGNHSVAELLLCYTSEVSRANQNSETPLSLALHYQHHDLVGHLDQMLGERVEQEAV